MSLFKNEKLEKVNEQLTKLESKRNDIVKSIEEMEAALEQTVELFALGEISQKDIEEAHDFLKVRRQELADVERMIAKVSQVRKKVAIETIPFVKEQRRKKVEAIQKKYDLKISKVIEAKNAFLRELAELGTIRNEVGSANNEFNDVMIEIGENPSQYGEVLNERKVFSPQGFTSEADCLGIKEDVQKQAYSGNVPSWVGGMK
ncbi:hypothetical protein [Priestia flexa]|uniref:hypothetical protein n=1 Tax=Priestia flexa TaxID=86664 RepID=UPI00099D8499|nr:hypothetical protein [Priestia flexa]AQX56043.1 hypothetical protein BC359_18185 [Priestia flexa]